MYDLATFSRFITVEQFNIEFLRFVELALARKLIIMTLLLSIPHLIHSALLIFILL